MNPVVQSWCPWSMAEFSSARCYAAICLRHLQEWSLWQSDKQSVWSDWMLYSGASPYPCCCWWCWLGGNSAIDYSHQAWQQNSTQLKLNFYIRQELSYYNNLFWISGVYGHSTVYHAQTESFYVFGGYMYGINRTFISNKLFAFHYKTRFWSILPTSDTSRLNFVSMIVK